MTFEEKVQYFEAELEKVGNMWAALAAKHVRREWEDALRAVNDGAEIRVVGGSCGDGGDVWVNTRTGERFKVTAVPGRPMSFPADPPA